MSDRPMRSYEKHGKKRAFLSHRDDYRLFTAAPNFVVSYPNGDEAQYVISAFECDVLRGTLTTATTETTDARYVSQSEAETLDLSTWLRLSLPLVFERDEQFVPASWAPAG